MRSLSEEQWERYEAIVAHLTPLEPAQRVAALHAYGTQSGEASDVLSLVALRFALLPEADRCRTGERLGQFTLREPLAHGGMGVVYHATQDIGCDVALKLIHPAFLAVDQHEAVERFQQEIAMLAKLEHPHIARIYDGGMYQDPVTAEVSPFFAMQLVRGGISLTTYAVQHALDMRERLRLFLEVCEGVQYAHTQGVLHRDLKPANLLVDVEGCPFVIDFGLAQACDTALLLTERTRISGTPAYLSPEQVSEVYGPVSVASDIYALGVILYELLAERRPYDVPHYASGAAIRHALLEAVPTPLGQQQVACRGVLESIVAMALARQPAERYPSVAALHTALAHYLEATALTPHHGMPTVGPWYLAEHRLVVYLRQGLAEHAVVTVETQAPELASATFCFTVGDEVGAVHLEPSMTQADTWSATHTFAQSFTAAMGSPHDWRLELPQPEQRLVTALLVTWSAASPAADTVPPVGDPARLLQCQQVVTETLQRYDGYVLRGIIDTEILALFGVPRVHEHAADRAVSAALDLRQALLALRGQVVVGIATGLVYFDPRRDTVYAAAINPLVRQVHAGTAPGEIRVDARTYTATAGLFSGALSGSPLPPCQPTLCWRGWRSPEGRQ